MKPVEVGLVDAGGRNQALQALRGVAATAVLVAHAAHFSAEKTGAIWLEQVFSGRFAFYGVLAFFVLSGFLMEAAVRRYDARTFLLHRFIRLYPTYWLLFLCFFFIQSARIGAWDSIPWKALTLLPFGEMFRPLHVEWTLLYEVFFYAVCAILCIWRRIYFPVMLVWLALVANAAFMHNQFGTTQPTLAEIPFSAWNIGFICGSLAGIANRSVRNVEPGSLWLCGATLTLLGELTDPGTRLFLAGPGMACIVVALVRSRQAGSSVAGAGSRALFMLGNYSYGLYLVHSLSIQIALQYVPASRLTEPLALFVGMMGVGLAAGIIAGGLDVMLYRILKTWLDARLGRASLRKPLEQQPIDNRAHPNA